MKKVAHFIGGLLGALAVFSGIAVAVGAIRSRRERRLEAEADEMYYQGSPFGG